METFANIKTRAVLKKKLMRKNPSDNDIEIQKGILKRTWTYRLFRRRWASGLCRTAEAVEGGLDPLQSRLALNHAPVHPCAQVAAADGTVPRMKRAMQVQAVH